MFNGNISQLDKNHSLSLFYSRRTPSKNKPVKKTAKFSLPSGEYLSPVKVNTTTPYNSTTTPILVHSLSDMSLKNETVDRIGADDSPTPSSRYSKIKTNSTGKHNKNTPIQSIEHPIPLYPNTLPQKLNIKSNSASKIEGHVQPQSQPMLTLPKFQRRSARMAMMMSEKKPVNLFTNMAQDEQTGMGGQSPLDSKSNDNTLILEKNQMNLDVQSNNGLGEEPCPCSKGFLNSDGIWEDPTLSQSESRCLQTPTVGNIMSNNESLEPMTTSNDKTLLWDFEDENKFNDKENIIPEDYKGGILAEREWCDYGNEEDDMMEEYDTTPNDYMISSSSQPRSTPRSSLKKGKRQSSGHMIKKSEYQHVRYAFQEISVNSMPEYQMGSVECNSVYSNSSFGSNCDSQFMATPKKCSTGFKMNNSFSNSYTNDAGDIDDTTPSFFNTLPLKNMKASASSSNAIKKAGSTKRLVYQLCGVPDRNAVHNKTGSRSKTNSATSTTATTTMMATMATANALPPSYMNSSPLLSKPSLFSPPFLLSSPVVRHGFSSPLVQAGPNDANPFTRRPAPQDPVQNNHSNDNDHASSASSLESLEDKTPKARKVTSLLTSSLNSSASEGKEDPPSPSPNDTLDGKVTPKPKQRTTMSTTVTNTVFFPHYHSRQNSRVEGQVQGQGQGQGEEENGRRSVPVIDDSLLNQTSSMMSISPETLSKISDRHQSFFQLNQTLDQVVQELSTHGPDASMLTTTTTTTTTSGASATLNLAKRGRVTMEEKKKELVNRRRSRLKKYGF